MTTEISTEVRPTETWCRCGKPAKRVHCPACGSLTVYGLPSRAEWKTLPGGTEIEVMSYRCRRCSHIFNDFEWMLQCEAPKLENKTMRERRLQDEAETKLAAALAEVGGDRKELLRRLLGKPAEPQQAPEPEVAKT